MATTQLIVRDARDRLIDLLGIGATYPLTDLPVRDEQLTVTFNTSAKIPIESSQKGVRYQLYDKNNQPVKLGRATFRAEGNGGTILLETPKIQDDVIYKILASKPQSGKQAYLQETADVKVGLDTSLVASISGVSLLDPTVDNPAPTEPRIVHYGAGVAVEIQKSQEGVDYRLVTVQRGKEVQLSVTEVRGDLGSIVLRTQPVHEDTDIRIRATKTFDPSENRPTQTALLNTVLPLKVRANPALQVSVEPSPIIGFKETATLKITGAQRSAKYQVYLRAIPDRDFLHGRVPDAEVLKVSIEGQPDARIRKPGYAEVWAAPQGYTALGELRQGTGGELRLAVEALTDDSLIIVQAQKEHQYSKAAISAVRLEQALVILVRPDPAPPLKLQALPEQPTTRSSIEVSGGQPGVFYHFRLASDSNELGLPAYFHKRDAADPGMNKGVDQLALEVDLVIARTSVKDSVSRPAQTPPEPPVVELASLEADSTLHVLAVKAQTGVAIALDNPVPITAVPEAGGG